MENETRNLVTWIESHRSKLSPYIPEEEISHRGIWGSHVMDNLTKDIKTGNKAAIDLGCELIAQDQKYAFGKIIKSNIARALKSHADSITLDNKKSIIKVTKKLLKMEHTPRETEDYCRLITKFSDLSLINELKSFTAGSESAERWLQYLNEKALTSHQIRSLRSPDAPYVAPFMATLCQ